MFISLDPSVKPGDIPLKGMRLGINGKEAHVGQAYQNLDTTIGGSAYQSNGQLLSSLGTVIASEKGADADEFFLTFETLAGHSNVVIDAAPLTPLPPAIGAPVADIGLRIFDEVNATMAEVTGVSTASANIKTTFDTIKQQLPTVENIQGFLSAHQVAVAQLAIDYCNELVEDPTLRSNFFGGGIDFNADVATAFGSGDSVQKNQIVDALLNNVVGSSLSSQPSQSEIKNELIGPAASNSNNLFDRLTAACPAGCDAVRTRTIVKAMCTAVLGSSAMLLQ
jgi:hypothetical protein